MPELSALLVNAQRQAVDYFMDPEWPSDEEYKKNINIVIRGDGIYEVRKTPFATFCARKEKVALPGFPKEDNGQWFSLNLPMIPQALLEEIIAFFQYFCKDSKKNDEAYIQIFWDEKNKKYFNFCPKQIIGSTSVRYERDQAKEEEFLLVCEIHSHNSMEAFFSSTDDRDEQNDRFYCVLGKLDKAVPDLRSSFVCGGKRVDIPSEDLWDIRAGTFPEEWKDQIEKEKPKIKVTPKGKSSPTKTGGGQYAGAYGPSAGPYFPGMGDSDDDDSEDSGDNEATLIETGNFILTALNDSNIEPQELEQLYLEFLMAMDEDDFGIFLDTIKGMGRVDELMHSIGFGGISDPEEGE